LCAFDLIELDGEDLRWHPLEQRKAALADLLGQVEDGVVYNEHFTRDSAIIFRHACALGCEGIVSKRSGKARGRRGLGSQAMGARAASLK
jgi:bifunctional non-homologous end joining protein LigD